MKGVSSVLPSFITVLYGCQIHYDAYHLHAKCEKMVYHLFHFRDGAQSKEEERAWKVTLKAVLEQVF